MALDGIFLYFIKNEINTSAAGCKVEKIHQPSKEELVFHLRGFGRSLKLFLSVRADGPRVHFTASAPENPASPPMFCMLMRKHLTNATLLEVRQNGLDRTLFIDFKATNEIGDTVRLTLAIEIMAKHSNIILFNEENKIIDSIKRIDLTMSTVRQILPGFTYTLPPAQDKLNLLDCDISQIIDAVNSQTDKGISSALLNVVQGFSPLICREVEYRCTMGSAFEEEIAKIKHQIETFDSSATLLVDKNGKPCEFSWLDISQYGELYTRSTADSFSELIDMFYYKRDQINRTQQKSHDIIKTLGNSINRIAKKINLQRQELEQCKDREGLRIKAELINVNVYSLEKGSLYYELENYYDENKIIRIKADPALTPAANSQKYFKEYRKAKKAEEMLTKLIEENVDNLNYLESVLDAISRAQTQAEIDEIRMELYQGGFMKKSKHQVKKSSKKAKSLPPIYYRTDDDFDVFVGRNNLQNDHLSLKTAGKGDMWLHTQSYPGSHVIIAADNREISDLAIEQAAIIAAYHSKAQNAALVPVDYTYVKNLKKPTGAKPGKVIYHVYYSINVTPDEGLIKRFELNTQNQSKA